MVLSKNMKNCVLCHISEPEIQVLTQLSGKQKAESDPQTGIRTFHDLKDLPKNPKFLSIMKIAKDITKSKNKNSIMSKITKGKNPKSVEIAEVTIEKKPGTAAFKIAQKGRLKDKSLALLPEPLVSFIHDFMGRKDKNPDTDLFEFGFFDEVLRVGGTILGAVVGGPVGAGIGNAVASKVTGKSIGNSLKSGLKNAALTSLIGQAGSFLGSQSPALASFGKSLPMAGLLAGATGMSAPTQAAQLSNAQQQANPNLMPSAANNIFSGLSPNILTTTGLGILADEEAKKELDAAEKAKKEEMRSILANMENQRNQRLARQMEMFKPIQLALRNGGSVQGYKKGGTVAGTLHKSKPSASSSTPLLGPGDGQDDHILTTVNQGDFIIDASTVADIGNGSTHAGLKVLNEIKNIIHKMFKVKKQKRQRVPVALANGEYKFDANDVDAIGLGDNKIGGQIFRELTKIIRLHKTSGPRDKLPPNIKNVPEIFLQLVKKYNQAT